jgi:hypothetical protein
MITIQFPEIAINDIKMFIRKIIPNLINILNKVLLHLQWQLTQ